jgi:putative transposase
MNTSTCVSSVSSYKGHRFPAGIISHCVWLYFRFSLSFRDVEEMMAERGVVVSYEQWRELVGMQPTI